MTREEAIDRLKEARAGHKEFLSVETLNMAIKALEQEPCEDCISRQAAIDALYKVDEYNGRSVKAIRNLPPVTPQPEIVRCSQCKYAEVADQKDSQDGYTCQFHRGSIWFSGSYCSWAERRECE